MMALKCIALTRYANSPKTYEIVYTPCHRSHIDYLLLSYVIFNRGLMVPHIAAGINLNLPIVGQLMRGAGAYFLRRTFSGNELYTSVFKEYLQFIVTQHPTRILH